VIYADVCQPPKSASYYRAVETLGHVGITDFSD